MSLKPLTEQVNLGCAVPSWSISGLINICVFCWQRCFESVVEKLLVFHLCLHLFWNMSPATAIVTCRKRSEVNKSSREPIGYLVLVGHL